MAISANMTPRVYEQLKRIMDEIELQLIAAMYAGGNAGPLGTNPTSITRTFRCMTAPAGTTPAVGNARAFTLAVSLTELLTSAIAAASPAATDDGQSL